MFSVTLFVTTFYVLVLKTTIAAQVKEPLSVIPISGKQTNECDRPATEFKYGGCPQICGPFSESSRNACENGPTYGCNYSLQRDSDDYCCVYDPRFGAEIPPEICFGDSVLFDGIPAQDAIRVAYVLILFGTGIGIDRKFDVLESRCNNIVDSIHKNSALPITLSPPEVGQTTNKIYPDRFWLCTPTRRLFTDCVYKYTANGRPFGSVTVKWRNIKGCYEEGFSGFP